MSAEIHALDGQFVLVAHSLGCALAAHWVSENLPAGIEASGPQLRAIMMVAPADVDSGDHTPDVVRSFAPMPMLALPCVSLVVASDDDPHVSIERARSLAKSWNSTLVEIGA